MLWTMPPQPLLTKAQANDLVKKGYLPKKYAQAAVKPVITKEEAVNRITSDDIERLFYPVIDTKKTGIDQLKNIRLGSGINAVPGAAAGTCCFYRR